MRCVVELDDVCGGVRCVVELDDYTFNMHLCGIFYFSWHVHHIQIRLTVYSISSKTCSNFEGLPM